MLTSAGEKLTLYRPQVWIDHVIPNATGATCHLLHRLGTMLDDRYLPHVEQELHRLVPLSYAIRSVMDD
ncbi:hypothetical protein [Pajaroellobacter abortibovis]|uniref:hypothetical protein n=1 Tax=Pajaroellobacter abortibovis TaxID=1882918 RepID=UPI0012EB430F|nr:hypothetical protein [Pajaroellobacter abortibovis]